MGDGKSNSVGAGPTRIETWPEYLRRIAAGHTQAQIAGRIGIGRLSVYNWLQGKTRPKAETVITVARVFGRPPVEALLAAAYLRDEELDQAVEVRVSPRDLPAEEIAAEVHRRLAALEEALEEGAHSRVKGRRSRQE
jgi:transcriptional regulator with XRE-family HTH domain